MTSDPKFEAELAAMEAVATARRASIPPLPEASLRELLPRNFVDARSARPWTTAAKRSRCGARNFQDSIEEITIAARNGHSSAPALPNSPT